MKNNTQIFNQKIENLISQKHMMTGDEYIEKLQGLKVEILASIGQEIVKMEISKKQNSLINSVYEIIN